MFIIGKWSIKNFIHLVIVLMSILEVSASFFCDQDRQYYNATVKQCLPCTICTSPLIVIAKCTVYSDAECGLPSFSKGGYLEVLPKKPLANKNATPAKSSNENSTIQINKSNGKKYPKGGRAQKNFKKYKRKFKNKQNRKKFSKNFSKLSRSSINKDDNSTILLLDASKENAGSNSLGNDYIINVTENNIANIENNIANISTPLVKEETRRNISVLSIGKYFILFAICTFNVLLVGILITKTACLICKKRSKAKHNAFPCTQKLPHPSQKPVKCRFTAVLPSKSAEYANVDTYLKPISTDCLNTPETATTDGSFPSSDTNHTIPETLESTSSFNPLSLNADRESTLNPLLVSSQEVESANMIQLYTRMPSPNPFTMDRLLEQRRAVGYSSVENNLYVETWCSSPSPMLPRSQESSVAPSPALSGVRKPLSSLPGVTSSNTSSPLTTRTFRATPAFTSFHPFRP